MTITIHAVEKMEKAQVKSLEHGPARGSTPSTFSSDRGNFENEGGDSMNLQPITGNSYRQAHRKGADIVDRLLDLAVGALEVATELPEDSIGKHIACQLLRAGTSPAAN